MDFKDHFPGKAVVITGAAGLFGRGLAQTFAAAGARICLTVAIRARSMRCWTKWMRRDLSQWRRI